MKIVPVIRFDLQFNATELSQHIALLQLGRNQLSSGKGYDDATALIDQLTKVLEQYERLN